MKTLIALLILCAPTLVWAAPTHYTLDLNVASLHTEKWARQDLNQNNLGLGVTAHVNKNWAVSSGFYRNSYRRTSVYALAQWTPIHIPMGSWRIDAGAEAGLVSGYRRSEVPSAPVMGAGLVRVVSPHGWSVNFTIVPNTPNRSSGFVGLQVSAPL